MRSTYPSVISTRMSKLQIACSVICGAIAPPGNGSISRFIPQYNTTATAVFYLMFTSLLMLFYSLYDAVSTQKV